jgi:hypothetical protein
MVFLDGVVAGTGRGIKAAKSETLQMWRIVVVLMADQVSMENKCNERRTSGAWVRVLVFAFNTFILFHSIHFIIPPPLLRQNFGFIVITAFFEQDNTT